jgi:xanthine dehydrogenase accessory factor
VRGDDPGAHRAVVSGPEDALAAAAGLIDEERFGATLTLVAGPRLGLTAVMDVERGLVAGALPDGVEASALRDATILVDRETSATVAYDGVEIFIDPLVPRPRLVVFGAVHIAQELSRHASFLGRHVTVSDSRRLFTTPERFPHADELLVGWPDQVADRLVLDRRTSVVVLSHDARFEDPLWPILLPTDVRYIGAMGSTRTASRRRERLVEAGWEDAIVDRIHGPIGLDIGSETPGEVAIAILAEMISRHRRPGEPLGLVGERLPLARRPPSG